MFNKKAISPVVAIALLLVVSVTAVFGFFTWFTQYSSGLQVGVEEEDNVGSTEIRDVVGDQLYFYADIENVTVTSVSVGGVDCAQGGTYSNELAIFSISTCTASLQGKSQQARIITNKGVFAKNVFISYLPS